MRTLVGPDVVGPKALTTCGVLSRVKGLSQVYKTRDHVSTLVPVRALEGKPHQLHRKQGRVSIYLAGLGRVNRARICRAPRAVPGTE